MMGKCVSVQTEAAHLSLENTGIICSLSQIWRSHKKCSDIEKGKEPGIWNKFIGQMSKTVLSGHQNRRHGINQLQPSKKIQKDPHMSEALR